MTILPRPVLDAAPPRTTDAQGILGAQTNNDRRPAGRSLAGATRLDRRRAGAAGVVRLDADHSVCPPADAPGPAERRRDFGRVVAGGRAGRLRGARPAR